jgi:hypothetical protein
MSSADSLTLFVFDRPTLTRRPAEFCFAGLDDISGIERLLEIAGSGSLSPAANANGPGFHSRTFCI